MYTVFNTTLSRSSEPARAVWRDGCVSGHHAPLPRAEAQGSDRAAGRRDAVSAQRRRRQRRALGTRHAHPARERCARIRYRHSSPSYGHGGRRKGDEERYKSYFVGIS